MKHIPLHDKHLSLGAKMVDFAGFSMPVQYEGVNSEHERVRGGVGVFDVSHMGEFLVSGVGALNLLQKISSNDVSKLSIGQAQYAYLPNETGGIIDDFITYRLADDSYLLVVNASNIDIDWAWVEEQNKNFGARIENVSASYSLLAVQGPDAIHVLQQLTDIPLIDIPYYHFRVGRLAQIDDMIISATGYTGSGGFELYCKNDQVGFLWDRLFEAGEKFGIKPIGLAARDTLRLEMGFCLYGNEITQNTSPLEAGLGWVTKFTKSFINSQALLAEKERGIQRKLVGFKLIDKGIPRHDYLITDSAGESIGVVTSGTMSPSLKIGIGMGYVPIEYSQPGSEIGILVRGKILRAQVVKTPFI